MGGILCSQSGKYTVNPEPDPSTSKGPCPIINKMCPKLMGSEEVQAIELGPAEREKKGIITMSWRKFMGNLYENSMDVFIMCLQDYPEYNERFHIAGLTDAEIRQDMRIKKHTITTINFIRKIVTNIDLKANFDRIIKEIEDYYKSIHIPGTAMIDYKDSMIKYMQEKGYITEKGANAWHSFIDEEMEKLKIENNTRPTKSKWNQ